ncbi:MAG: hypothetical protein ACOC22_01325 [bacterium]
MLNKEYRFVRKWDIANDDVNWIRESRTELNKIIEEYNQWQINGFHSGDDGRRLLALIEYGKQIIGTQGGGESYMDELLGMENFVIENRKRRKL